MNKIAPIAASLLLAGCPEQIGDQCPPRTISVGTYSLGFEGQHPAGECVATLTDGGPLGPVAKADGGTRGASICFGAASDGGPQLSLVVPGKAPRTSDLLVDGGFHFAGHDDAVPGTSCTCPVSIDETFDGYLQATSGAPVALLGDGGLPDISGLSGILIDNLGAPSGTAGCTCNLPCSVQYGINGSRF